MRSHFKTILTQLSLRLNDQNGPINRSIRYQATLNLLGLSIIKNDINQMYTDKRQLSFDVLHLFIRFCAFTYSR